MSNIKDLRKKQIIESVLDLVEDGGLKNITTKNVAENVGISESSLYNIFSSKDEMLLETIKYLDNRRKEMSEPLFKEDFENIEELIEKIVKTLKEIANDKYCNADLAISFDRVLSCDLKAKDFLQNCAKDDLEQVKRLLLKLNEIGLISSEKFENAAYALLIFVIGHIYYNLMFHDRNTNDDKFEKIIRKMFEFMSKDSSCCQEGK